MRTGRTQNGMIGRRPHNTALLTAIATVVFFGSMFQGWISNGEVLAQTRASRSPKILQEIPYVEKAGAKVSRRQTLDLYLPVKTKSKPPLLIFIHGGFWTLSDDDYAIGPAIADVLSARDIAVALVRYRLAPTHRHPAQAEDVAAAVAYLARKAAQYGYDAKKIFLGGHSAGAHLAALVALDPAYLSKHRMSPQSLAGVIAISGIYNLVGKMRRSEQEKTAVAMAFGNNRATLKEASPVTHVRAQAPPFLILTAADDLDGLRIDGRKFAQALRAAGHQETDQQIIAGRDHFSIVKLTGLDNPVRSRILAFLKVEPLPPDLRELLELKRKWLNPPFSTEPFWRYENLIRSYPIDRRFMEFLLPFYGPMRHELLEWPLEKYHAIGLFSYLDALPERQVGRGDYLVITNVRGEKQFWSRKQIQKYQPVIVVGIDDERNLFRFTVFFRMMREYSWEEGPEPPVIVRPVGAFVYFLKEPPPELQPRSWHSGLTADSFRLVENNPLAPISKVPKPVYATLTYRNGCIYCHRFRTVGARSHHNRATTGAAAGGFALALEEYPPEVWKAFIFNQHEVARKMGATPNVVERDARQALYDLVVQSREKSFRSAR
jgi:arylformamidase